MNIKKLVLSISILATLVACDESENILVNSPNQSVEQDQSIGKKALRDGNDPNITFYDFGFGISALHGGCTARWVSETSTGLTDNFYGPIPTIYDNGAVIRGYGLPTHNQYRNTLIHTCRMNLTTRPGRDGSPVAHYVPQGSAISIEHNFEYGYTYEIQFRTTHEDVYQKFWNDDNIPSAAHPNVFCQLTDTGVIPGDNPCEGTPLNITASGGTRAGNSIYQRKLQHNDRTNQHRSFIYSFTFTPQQQKNAFIISVHPSNGPVRDPDPKRNASGWIMTMPWVKVIKKPFNSAINDINNPDRQSISLIPY